MSKSCNICTNKFDESEIMTLSCGHIFNWKCIELHFKNNLRSEKFCPVSDCNKAVTDSEIRLVLNPDDLEEYESNFLQQASGCDINSNRNAIASVAACPLIPNTEIFLCEMCCREIGKGRGLKLRNCFENICRDCLCEHVKSSDKIPIPCPFLACQAMLDDRECREILPEDEKIFYERRSLSNAQTSANKFKDDHCRKTDCSYLCDVDSNLKSWICPSCKSMNCITCNAIHTNMSCYQYKSSVAALRDKDYITEKIRNKELMKCPQCNNLIKKTGGCNWIPCPGCNTELCWITQQRRWGSRGLGDTSGGCRCGVYGPCHPQCGGCTPDGSRRDPYAQIYNPPPPDNSCAVM